MNLLSIVAEIGTVLSSAGIHTYAVPPALGNTPAVVINEPTQIEYFATANGKCIITLPITLYTAAADLASAWNLIYKLLSTDEVGFTSLPDAIYNHQSPTAFSAWQVTTASNFQAWSDSGISATLNLIIKS